MRALRVKPTMGEYWNEFRGHKSSRLPGRMESLHLVEIK